MWEPGFGVELSHYSPGMETKSRSRARGGEVSDRERIAMAVGELVQRGYLTMPPWSVCCSNCGWGEVGRMVGADDELPPGTKAVWWHEQNDSYAFVEDAGAIPQTAGFLDEMTGHDDDEEWFDQHMEHAEADSILARLTEFNQLLAPLYVHWLGDALEISAALRAQGLRVVVPDDESKCIVVLPTHTSFHARPVNGEVYLEIDDNEIQMTAADARRLVRRLNRAARLAEAQMPTL